MAKTNNAVSHSSNQKQYNQKKAHEAIKEYIYNYTRRSTVYNRRGSEVHLDNQILINLRAIKQIETAESEIVNQINKVAQSGYEAYTKSYAKKLARAIKSKPKTIKHKVVLTSESRISRAWSTFEKFQRDLRAHDVTLIISVKNGAKEYQEINLKEIKKSDIETYESEIRARLTPTQERYKKLCVKMINLGIAVKEAYKMTHTWEGSIKAYQAKNRATSKIIRGVDNARIKRSRTVLKMYKKGAKTREIAKETGYSERRVRGIMQEYREVMAETQQLNQIRRLQETQAKKAEKASEPTVKTIKPTAKNRAIKAMEGAKKQAPPE